MSERGWRVWPAGARPLLKLALLLALAALSACAVPPQAPTQDLRTASDLTDQDRRARIRMELAAGYFSRGQFATALDEVKQALVARPELPQAFNLRGLIYASLGEHELAESSYRRALQLAPRDSDTMHNYGWFLCQLQRWDEATVKFEQAIAQPQYRDAPRTLLAQGVCLARAGRLAEAERSLSRSYEMDPGNLGTAFNLGEVLYKLNEFERARFYVRRLNAETANSNAQTLWLAARIENRLGNDAGVRGFGKELRERCPESPETLLFDRGRFDG
jgi:type IV pilus assembly protein PilF